MKSPTNTWTSIPRWLRYLFIAFSLLSLHDTSGQIISFDELPLAPDSFYNGNDLAGGFTSQGVHFKNIYNTNWFIWSGFAYSNVNNTNTAGFLNQYAVISGTDVSGTGHYSIGYDDSFGEEPDIITLPEPALLRGLFLNNTTYAALAMMNGDAFSKKFGGPSGTDPDFFELAIEGKDEFDLSLGTNYFALADFTFPDSSNDYIITEWTWVDLTDFGSGVKTLHFSLTSTDTNAFGINTPTYFALDELTLDSPFACSTNGIPLHAAQIKGWITDIISYTQPDPASGGFFLDNDFNSSTLSNAVLGRPLQPDSQSHVLSLGDDSELIVSFEAPIGDGPGPDFAVFENAFDVDSSFFSGTPRENHTNVYTFAELARVAVSSDGVNWAEFPFRYLNNENLFSIPICDTNQFSSQNSKNIDGLAGKHTANFGTPFDLSALQTNPKVLNGLVSLYDIQFIKLHDVPGDGSVTDNANRPVFDPTFRATDDDFNCATNLILPHAAVNDGFDLKGIAVLNYSLNLELTSADALQWFAASNTTYQIQNTESLFTNWQPVSQTTGAHTTITMPISATNIFYRVVINP